MQMRNNMQMIFYSIYTIQVTSLVLQNAPNVFVQLISIGFQHAWISMLGTEDDLIEDLGIGAHSVISRIASGVNGIEDFQTCGN